MSRASRYAHVIGAALGLLLPVAADHAEAQQANAVLTLRDVITATIDRNPSIRASRQQVDAARGALMSASGAFDPQVRTSVGQSRVGDPPSLTSSATDPIVTHQTTYSLGIDQARRSGITIAPQVSVTHTNVSLAQAIASNRASAGVTATVPLLNNRGGAAIATPERVAERGVDIATLSYRGATIDAVRQATAAYLTYAASRRRLEVQIAAEQRAHVMLTQTQALVAADERAPSDLIQLRASATFKEAARLTAEQAMNDAWRQLALIMGRDAADAGAPPAIDSLALPPLVAYDSSGLIPARLLAIALERRLELSLNEAREQQAVLLRSAAEQDALPHLDVSLGLSYVGMQKGLGVQNFFEPLLHVGSGLNATLQLQLQRPLNNTSAHGRALSSAAVVDQTRIARETTLRELRWNVASSTEAVRRGAGALARSQLAAQLARTAVDAQQRRFQLGAATLFDVLNAEDGLTNALVSEVSNQTAYALALLSLRYETGTLWSPSAGALERGAPFSIP